MQADQCKLKTASFKLQTDDDDHHYICFFIMQSFAYEIEWLQVQLVDYDEFNFQFRA